ncbi:hypothetical protein PIB30_061251 [Stylosanthes scabra]|uniref:Uncharacterized protein n=1 Tax=Stylosanthes scabra TaxID=79078 RepID=A0ABU6YNC1_9FABA|nr:hypothetical protein [Stylosanthes scabra]
MPYALILLGNGMISHTGVGRKRIQLFVAKVASSITNESSRNSESAEDILLEEFNPHFGMIGRIYSSSVETLVLRYCVRIGHLERGRKEFWETQKRLEAQLATVTELETRLVTPSVASTSITSQPLNSGDLPSQALSIPRRSIPSLFLCANQEGREDAPLNEGDVENLNHEEVRECLEEVEENKDKEQKGMEIVHSALSKATPSKLPSELQFEWVNFSNLNFIGQLKALCGVLDKKKEDSAELGSEFKAYSGYLHKLHNNRTNVGALSSKKHLGPWKFHEKLVDSQKNGWTNQVWDPGKSYKSQHFWRFITYLGVLANLIYMTWNLIENTMSKHWWRFIASIEALRSLVHAVWDTRDQCNNKNWWRFQEEFKHKPP